jgi:sucrose synthase
MHELVRSILDDSDEKTALRQLICALSNLGKRYFLRTEILQAFADYCERSQKPHYFYYSSHVGKLIHYSHEMILAEESTWFVVRPRIASQEYWRLSADLTRFDPMPSSAYLEVSDRLVNSYQPNILEIDFSSFYRDSPSIQDPRNIGQGLAFLNRYLCTEVITDPLYFLNLLFQLLHELQYDGITLLINDRIPSGTHLAQQIPQAIKFLSEQPQHQPCEQFRFHLQELGFEPGWGNTAARVCETLQLLQRLIDNPHPAILEAFVSRIPTIFRVVLVSIHGWVAQEDVLGRDETLGQVIYVLEQARSLENQLRAEIELAGLNLLGIKPHVIILTRLIPNCEGTFCNLRLEKLLGTDNAWILRVPFTDSHAEITDNWISKFEIWPYLEKFALDAQKELLAQFQGNPHLIIGNYSDGNLVAFLLARRFKSINCNIAHSLEKPKYLFSSLYWQNLEEQYHFSAQFTADLISMNAADIIVTSSYQEIVGTPDTIGQYESYKCFTMPKLYHVVDGIDLFSPKFNMVPPGVNEHIFFNYNQKAERNSSSCSEIQELLFSREHPHILGHLNNPQKRPILSVAPITSIKNLTGLAECFGKSQDLQQHCNLIILTSKLHPDEATNAEDAREIQKLHDIINEYHLQGHIRWIGMRIPIHDIGEAYRVVADYQGIYIHFAHFEAFGRSILEAMISGLPTFATQFGGALEIIEDQSDRFYLNPTDFVGTANKIVDFLEECDAHPQYWHEVSEWMNQRIQQKYNWNLHTNQLVLLSKIFSFWNFIASDNKDARLRYLETLFYLFYKPRAERIIGHGAWGV